MPRTSPWSVRVTGHAAAVAGGRTTVASSTRAADHGGIERGARAAALYPIVSTKYLDVSCSASRLRRRDAAS